MISEQLNSIDAGLDRLAAGLSGEQAELARLCQSNLRAVAEQAEMLEGGLCILSAFGIERLHKSFPDSNNKRGQYGTN